MILSKMGVYKYIFSFERNMKVLKGYVRNHNRPKGCIAECYVTKKAIEFCIEYLSNVKAVRIPRQKNYSKPDRPLSSGQVTTSNRDSLENAHLYVLRNTPKVDPYMEYYLINYFNSNYRLENYV